METQTFANTIEYEKYRKWHVNMEPNQQVRIQGGLAGKVKYQEQRYQDRTTYTVAELDSIVEQMKTIGKSIDPKWSDLQKSRYVYDLIAQNISYDHNYATRADQASVSNLKGLLTGQSICAGYSLIYKELMDRQKIGCSYIRGIACDKNGASSYHAWNVLHIDGKNVPIDITWDSVGHGNVKHFGNNCEFQNNHFPDSDENQYELSFLTEQGLGDSIPTYNPVRENISKYNKHKGKKQEKLKEAPVENIGKHEIIEKAIMETVQKKIVDGDKRTSSEIATKMVISYLDTNNILLFTREKNAREDIQKYITKNDIEEYISAKYCETIEPSKLTTNDTRERMILISAVGATKNAYGLKQSTKAMGELLKNGSARGITNQGEFQGRTLIERYVNKEKALELSVSEVMGDLFKQHEKGLFTMEDLKNCNLPKQGIKETMKSVISWMQTKGVKGQEQTNEKNKDGR